MNIEEYARQLDKKRSSSEKVVPAAGARLSKIKGVKALLCDVYGTILANSAGSPSDLEKNESRVNALEKTIKEFGFTPFLKKLAQKAKPNKTLGEMYLQEIGKVHAQKKQAGIKYPEVRIEQLWQKIIKRMQSKGYSYNEKRFGNIAEFSLKVAYYYYQQCESNRSYKNAFQVLKKLKQQGIALGIVSNAQFYTPINLEIEFRKASKGKTGFYDLFDKKVVSFSHIVGESKPGTKIFQKALKALKAKGIKKSEAVYIGNDMKKDIAVAKKLGFKAVLFAGDRNSLKMNAKARPDAIITGWKQLEKVLA